MSIKSNKRGSVVGHNLRRLTMHHDISFRRLSKDVGFTHSYLAKLAKNKYASPGIEALQKIAGFFKIPLAQLIGEKKINFKKLPKIN